MPNIHAIRENEVRSRRGDAAIASYSALRGEPSIDDLDAETMLTDLLADLAHWARARSLRFGEAMTAALAHYGVECDDEGLVS
jgi:hypothetical protein